MKINLSVLRTILCNKTYYCRMYVKNRLDQLLEWNNDLSISVIRIEIINFVVSKKVSRVRR